MKKLLLVLALGLSSGNALAIDECFTGSWHDSNNNLGEGINLEILPNKVVGYFYTWTEGKRNMYTLEGVKVESTVLMNMHSSYWTEGNYRVRLLGASEITVLDENTITFSYELFTAPEYPDFFLVPPCTEDCSAIYEYTRLTQPIPCS